MSVGKITSPITPLEEVNKINEIIDNLGGGVSPDTLVDLLFPIGSVYIGTGSTCPLAAIKGTWTLKSSGIVTSVDTSVSVKGDGNTLGLTENSKSGAITFASSSMNIYTGGYGVSVGTTRSGSSAVSGNFFGVTTDATKSGLTGTVTRTSLSVNIWERTA